MRRTTRPAVTARPGFSVALVNAVKPVSAISAVWTQVWLVSSNTGWS